MIRKYSTLLAIALVCVLGLGSTVLADQDPYYSDFDAAMAAAKEKDMDLLIKFYTDWCHWCHTIDTVVLVQDQAKEFFTNEMLLVKVNAEVDTLLAKKYAISGYPTLVLVHPDGVEIDRLVGYEPIAPFLQHLRDYKNGIGTLDDLLNKAKASTDRGLYMEIADKYKYRGGPEDAKIWFTKVVESGSATDSLAGEARMSLADMIRRAKDYDAALAKFQAIEKDFGDGMFAETAAIWQAIVYRQKGDTVQAISGFERYISAYPNAEDVEYAQKQIEKLKNPPVEDGKS